MERKMAKKIFITGTGTDLGKTYVSALIAKKLTESGRITAYYKAAMSGNERRADGSLIPGDAFFVKKVSGIHQSLEDMCPFVYENAYSPHLASRIEGNPVEMEIVKQGFEKVCVQYDYVIMEGSGGILCPLRFDKVKLQLEDVIQQLGLACLIVADAGLGTINQVVLTVEYMRNRKIPIHGIIYNHYEPGNVLKEDNIAMCEQLTHIPTIAKVQEGQQNLDIEADTLAGLFV